MIKKTISYVDYNGNERKEDFYFNLSKAELLDMELFTVGGFENQIKRIVAEQDVPKLIEIFQDIIKKSYGVKSDDGKRFIKNEDVLNEFIQTEAYSELYMNLVFDADEAADFINGLIPSDLQEKIKQNLSSEQ